MTTIREQRAQRLALEPLVESGPGRGLAAGTVRQFRDIWSRRELLGLLVRREIKARYKDSTLGFFWSLVRPLTMLAIYYVAVGKFLNAAGAIPSFAIYVFTGLTAWNLFNEIVSAGTASIVANAGLVKKVYLPREIFPLSAAGSALFNFVIQLIILVAAVLVSRQLPTWQNLAYGPLAFVVICVWGIAFGIFLSAANVYLRDVQYLVEVALMILFWASPVVYSWTNVRHHVSGPILDLYLSNPMTLAVLGFQRAFWAAGDSVPPPQALGLRLGVALIVGLALTWIAQRLFVRLQGNFAQEL